MRAFVVIAGLWIGVVSLGAVGSSGATPPPRDTKHPVEWWTRSTAPNVALFDSLDKIAWPAAKARYDTTIASDPAWRKHYGTKPVKLERRMFRFGPTIRRWEQHWVVTYGGASSGPGVQVVIAANGRVESTRASLSVK